MFLRDEEVSIPAEAIEYIEEKLKLSKALYLLKFEIIEIFFEWIALQDISAQRDILRKALVNGRREANCRTTGEKTS